MNRDDAAVLIGQWLDATGARLPASAVERVADILSATDDEDVARDGGPLDVAMEAELADVEAEGDRIRRDCQMQGASSASGLTIRPNGEFIAQSGPAEVRERSLRGWPTSPHWYVEMVAADGSVYSYTGDDLRSWADVAIEAERLAAELAAQEERRLGEWQRRVRRAAESVRSAEAALAAAQRDRDAMIRKALDAGLSVVDAARTAGLNRQRVYQIRQPRT